jgi:hypothetical protein
MLMPSRAASVNIKHKEHTVGCGRESERASEREEVREGGGVPWQHIYTYAHVRGDIFDMVLSSDAASSNTPMLSDSVVVDVWL